MKNPKAIPHIIQKLLDFGLDDHSKDCDSCNGEGTIELVEDHLYLDETMGFQLEVPVFICSQCGEESYSNESYLKILQQVERVKGKNYIKIEVKDGEILRYAIH